MDGGMGWPLWLPGSPAGDRSRPAPCNLSGPGHSGHVPLSCKTNSFSALSVDLEGESAAKSLAGAGMELRGMVPAVGRRFVHPSYHCGRRAYQFSVDVNLPAVRVRLDNDCHANPLAVIPAGVGFIERSDTANPFGRFLWVRHCPPADRMV